MAQLDGLQRHVPAALLVSQTKLGLIARQATESMRQHPQALGWIIFLCVAAVALVLVWTSGISASQDHDVHADPEAARLAQQQGLPPAQAQQRLDALKTQQR